MQNDNSDQPQPKAEENAAESGSASTVYPAAVKGVGTFQPIVGANTDPEAALSQGSLSAPTSSSLGNASLVSADGDPVPVVQVLSIRGVEYLMMTLALWFVAAALMWALLALVNGRTGFEILAFPISMMLVSSPLFAFFYIRLRKAELENPALRTEPSKRRLSQITQVITYLICLFNLIGFVYVIMTKIGGTGEVSIGKAALNVSVVLAISGGILAYYWFDEHKGRKG